MKLRTSLLLLATGLLGLVGSASAQIQTFDTRPSYQGSVINFNGGTFGETFTGVYSVQTMTYNFFAGGGTPGAVSLAATFGQWNGSNFVGGTTVSFGTIVIPASNAGGWSNLQNNTNGSYTSYSATFDFTTIVSPFVSATYGYITNPANTYALMLTDQTGGTNLGLGFINTNPFAYGAAAPFGINDWTFSQVVVSTSAIPEASTVASLAALVLVAGLVALRLRQRRALALAPVAA
ncbi:MAG: hypothetical protein KF715_07595 [Candidatus Didemnitutus sp.]|nr:hypothetical protein [Candidatus Didemnitutus sp.]